MVDIVQKPKRDWDTGLRDTHKECGCLNPEIVRDGELKFCGSCGRELK